jgi:hypothetical protein
LTRTASLLTALALWAAPLSAQSVGYFGEAQTQTGTAITNAGFTAVGVADMSTFDLATVDLFVHLNGDNDAPNAPFLARQADLATWLAGGGRLMIFDRFVGTTAGVAEPSWVPWASFTATRSFTDDDDIDVLPTAGAFGSGLTNASLDGGTSSSHGFVQGLPAGSVALLSRSNPLEYVAFYTQIGDGFLFYSTIPMDYYFDGSGDPDVRAEFEMFFATALNAFADLGTQQVPEPTSIALLAVGALGLGVVARRRRA